METLSDIFTTFVDHRAPTAFRAYDGSVAGPKDAVGVVEIRSPLAVRYVLSAPGELGLARAYVTGALDVRGDLHAALREFLLHVRRPRRSEILRALRRADWHGFRRAPVPQKEAPPRWRRGLLAHTKQRDTAAIAHHYDLSNRFYELLLGSSMAYSCAIFGFPGQALDEVQANKFDLACRKLDLRPGQRLLDVGAGWGGMVMHAAANYGVLAVGVTLSRQQAQWAQQAISRQGLTRRAQVRLLDYRDLKSGRFDAISSIGATENFGSHKLGSHFASMAGTVAT